MTLARPRLAFTVVALLASLASQALIACGSDGGNGSDDAGGPSGDATTDAVIDGTIGETTDAADSNDTDETSSETASEVSDAADASETTDAITDADIGGEVLGEAGVCVDGAIQSCHLIIHTDTDAGVIDCTTAKQTCIGGAWGTCGVELAFCPSSTMAQTVTLYVTPDAPPGFESTWNSMVSSSVPYGTQLFFDRLTTSPATPTLQVLQSPTAPAISLDLNPGGPLTTPVTIDPTTRILHSDPESGNFAFDIQNVSSSFVLPISTFGFDGHLDGSCLSTDDLTITTVVPQSAGVLAFQGSLVSTLMGPTTVTTPVPGWAITFTTTNPALPTTTMSPRVPTKTMSPRTPR